MRKVYKKQFGGFGIDPSLGGLLNGIDLNNLDFNQVAQLGSQIGGDPFDQAMLQDDPALYTNSMIGSASRDFATANNPLRTQVEIEDEAKKRTFLGIGKRRATRKLEQENQDRFDLNENTAGNNAQDTLTQFGNLQGLFNLIGNFQKGGNLRKLQTGGKSSLQFIQDTDGIAAKIKALPDTKEGRLAISGILASHMGVEIDLKPDSPNWVKRFKEEYEVDVDDKGKGTNKLTPAFLNKMADEFRRFSLKSKGVMMEFQDGGNMQQGGKPIYVTDPNDPRYIAYQDSLSLFNRSQEVINFYKNNPDYEFTGETLMGKEDQSRILNDLHGARSGFKSLGGVDSITKKYLNESDYYKELSDNRHEQRELNFFQLNTNVKPQIFDKRITPDRYFRFVGKKDTPVTGDIAGIYSYSDKVAPKPKGQEYRLIPKEVILPKRDQVNIEQLPPVSINQLAKERPLPKLDVENSFFEKGHYIQDWKGVPNLKIVSMHRKGDGNLVPVAIENGSGERIDYKKYKDKPLPKGFQYGQKMELGGKAKLGYSDNSPYRNESQITIPGNNITMANTGQPLMAYPNIGSPKLLKPYSGTHLFPDATSVTEIPLMRKGGKKKKKMRYYQDGGNPIPAGVQLEEEEMILTPNMDILDTAARESHKKMDKDEVTDIIRPEDYVLSDKLKITKKEAENMSLGYGAMLYKEGKIPKMPEEHTIASFFKEGEKEMTLAEYGKRIRKKLPITDKKDVFSLKTNDANRAARLPYIASAVYINEKKRTKGKPEASFASTFENKFEGTFGAQSGRTEQGRAVMALPGEPQEMQGGGPLEGLNPIGTAFTIGTGLYDMFIGAPKRKRIALAALDQDNKDINTLAGSQSGFSNAATVAALAGYSFQDPTVNAPQYDSTQLDQRVRRVPKTLFDYASGRAMAGFRSAQDSIFKNAGSFSQAVNAISPMYASNVGMTANLGMQEVQQNIGLENQYRDLKQTFNDRQTTVDNTARNATRTNTNALVAGTAGTLSGGISTQGNIEANRQNALRSNKMQGAQAKINANQQGVQSAYNIGTMAMMLPNNMFNQPQGVNNNLPYIAPPQPYNAPTQLNQPTPFGLNPIAPTIPYGTGVPTNQQGSTVPLGPNSVFDPATGLWYG